MIIVECIITPEIYILRARRLLLLLHVLLLNLSSLTQIAIELVQHGGGLSDLCRMLGVASPLLEGCLLYTSDAADE